MPLQDQFSVNLPIPNSDTHPLAGQVRHRQDANGHWHKEIRLIHAGAATAVSGQPYVFNVTGLSSSGFTAIDPAAVATVQRQVVFAEGPVGINQSGWYTFAGIRQVSVSGNVTVNAGDYLKLAPATSATALVKDATTQSNSSVAVARAAGPAVGNPSTSLIEVHLLSGEKVINT